MSDTDSLRRVAVTMISPMSSADAAGAHSWGMPARIAEMAAARRTLPRAATNSSGRY